MLTTFHSSNNNVQQHIVLVSILWLYFSSSGNQIHISQSTYCLLKKFKVFDMKKRGSISVKVCNAFHFFKYVLSENMFEIDQFH